MKTATLIRNLSLAAASMVFAAVLSASENPRSGETMTVALNDARALVAHRADFKVVRVEGDSMLPFFGNGSVLVVKKISSEKLRVGMVVVYTNRFSETVAHRLVAASTGGWEVRGYNNAKSDSTLVSDANIIGVVYATFHSDDRADVSLASAAAAGTSLAYAAPAR
jgi:signal peptidase I